MSFPWWILPLFINQVLSDFGAGRHSASAILYRTNMLVWEHSAWICWHSKVQLPLPSRLRIFFKWLHFPLVWGVSAIKALCTCPTLSWGWSVVLSAGSVIFSCLHLFWLQVCIKHMFIQDYFTQRRCTFSTAHASKISYLSDPDGTKTRMDDSNPGKQNSNAYTVYGQLTSLWKDWIGVVFKYLKAPMVHETPAMRGTSSPMGRAWPANLKSGHRAGGTGWILALHFDKKCESGCWLREKEKRTQWQCSTRTIVEAEPGE